MLLLSALRTLGKRTMGKNKKIKLFTLMSGTGSWNNENLCELVPTRLIISLLNHKQLDKAARSLLIWFRRRVENRGERKIETKSFDINKTRESFQMFIRFRAKYLTKFEPTSICHPLFTLVTTNS